MGKGLSRIDFFLMLSFILLLFLIVAAFFLGVKIGKEQTEKKYEPLLTAENAAQEEISPYDQRHLVSFYHNVFLPYREFHKKWFEHMNALSLAGGTANPAALIEELANLAEKQHAAIRVSGVPGTAPLLQEAHSDLLKSLKLFANGLSQTRPAGESGEEWQQFIENNEYITEAKNLALSGQRKYFASIVKWNESVDPLLKHTDLLAKQNLSPEQWNQLNLNEKNQYIATVMETKRIFEPFYPQDVTIRVDEIIRNGTNGPLKLGSIDEIVDTLIMTGAVRYGDFIEDKNRYYAGEQLPQLPFFAALQ
jgi:hypothetical protein